MNETNFQASSPKKPTAQELLHCFSDVWWRLENLYKVQDENGKIVQFTLRPAQRLLLMSLWYRNILLKARQLGFTTVAAIFALDRCLFNRGFHAGIIAHTKDDVIKIFETKVRFAYEQLPKDIKRLIPAKSDRANELQFQNGSSIRVAVSMRSGTLQLLHISEYGKLWAQFPRKAKEVQTGSLPTVHENGIIIIESTAEGVGGDYHAKCMAAIAAHNAITGGTRGPLAKKEYRFHFFPWHANPGYKLTKPKDYQFSSDLQAYFAEVEKITGKKLSEDQKFWYEITQIELGEILMKQEHPSYPEEAFLFSGRKAFDPKSLRTAEKACTPPIWQGDINVADGRLVERKDGSLLLWAMPVDNLEYVIGADVAEGLAHGDYSSADVLDQTGHQVAHLHGHMDPDTFGRALYWLGKHFNEAFLGVERNNHGHAVLQRLKDLEYRRLYVQQTIEKRTEEETPGEKVGWLTTQVSKPFIIDNLDTLLRQGESGLRNIDTVTEMHQFIIDDRGRYGAQENCNDDRVMSFAIAHEMLRVKPRKARTFTLTRNKITDWRA